MYLLLILTLFIFLTLLLLIIYPLKVRISYDSELNTELHILLTWLNPIFRAVIERGSSKPTLKAYLFNKKIISKDMKHKKYKTTNNMDLLRIIRPDHVKLQTYYGFEDPFMTGTFCGTFDFVSEYVDLEEVYNNPDFCTDHDYISIKSEAEIHILPTFIRYIKSKTNRFSMQPMHGNK